VFQQQIEKMDLYGKRGIETSGIKETVELIENTKNLFGGC